MNDNFDFDGKQSSPQRAPLQMWDMLSILVLVITACIGVYFLLIFVNPVSPLNPFPPGPRGFATFTFTPGPQELPATWTASPTLELTPSNTPRPTFTPFSTQTPFSFIPPTKTPRPTSTPKAPFSATVNYIESTIFHPELGCSFLGVGGEAVDVNNSPHLFATVMIGGTLGGQTIDPNMHMTVTGVATQYGKAGFEYVLGSTPVNSSKTLWIQLFDQSGIPLSDKVYFNTYTDCKKNLIQVRFKANR